MSSLLYDAGVLFDQSHAGNTRGKRCALQQLRNASQDTCLLFTDLLPRSSRHQDKEPSSSSSSSSSRAVAPPPGKPQDAADLSKVLSYINTHKLTSSNKAQQALTGAQYALNSSGKWVQPSGPRKPGEGVEQELQGIISADYQSNGCAASNLVAATLTQN